MHVYFIRHGIAAPREDFPENDENRPLTKKGHQKTTNVGLYLANVGLAFDLILCSPLLRAVQTAEILKNLGLTSELNTYEALKPGGKIECWLQWLEHWQRNNPTAKLALVGHQPDLGNWSELLIWGTIKGQIKIKKAGIVGLELPNIGSPVSRSTLSLLLSPKWTSSL